MAADDCGFRGFHEFTVGQAGDGTVLRHTLAMQLRGAARLSWPLVFRPLHDALIEDSLDCAEHATTGQAGQAARWSRYVRVLRRLLRGAGAVAGADDGALVGVDGDLDAVAQGELSEDAGDVAYDGGLAEVEAGGDLGVGQPLGYQADDAEFAFGEGADGRPGAGGGAVAAAGKS